jgi:cytochrome c oxidase accessory protein FixG
LSYIIGTDGLWKLVNDSPQNHLRQLGAMIVFTYVFYFVYARFREQVCTTVCPYGRLQGVMLDKNTINVAYDYVRGEKRGYMHRGENRKQAGKGDCIDCALCVSVCPTGIDIRNGTQLECLNCTACIDTCNTVMQKVGLPTGLIRYASEEGIAKGEPFKWTKKLIGYSVVLALLVVSLAVLLITRTEVQTSILRTPGMLYHSQGNHLYSNLYNVKVVNKTRKHIPLHFKLENMKGEIRPVGQEPDVKPKSIAEGAFFIVLDERELKAMKTKIKVGVYYGKEQIETVETTFIGPSAH